MSPSQTAKTKPDVGKQALEKSSAKIDNIEDEKPTNFNAGPEKANGAATSNGHDVKADVEMADEGSEDDVILRRTRRPRVKTVEDSSEEEVEEKQEAM